MNLDPSIEARVRYSFAQQTFMQTIGASISSVEFGRAVLSLVPGPGLTQQHGFLHAAVVVAILDSACGYAALTTMPPGSEVLSVEFKVNMLSPATGESFVARASVKRAGRRLTVTEADCFAVAGSEEKLVATMLGTMIRVETDNVTR